MTVIVGPLRTYRVDPSAAVLDPYSLNPTVHVYTPISLTDAELMVSLKLSAQLVMVVTVPETFLVHVTFVEKGRELWKGTTQERVVLEPASIVPLVMVLLTAVGRGEN